MRTLGMIATLLTVAGCSNAPENFISFDSPPAVTILSPLDDEEFTEDDGILFQAKITDNSPLDELVVVWYSSIDGEIPNFDLPDQQGYVQLATANLSIGSHVVTLQALDANNQQGEARVTIHIEGLPDHPTLDVVQPTNNGQGLQGFPFEFLVRVSDHQDPPDHLIVTMEEQNMGLLCTMVPDSNGIATCSESLPVGQYVLTFTVEDTEGFTATRNVVFEMVDRADFDADLDGFSPNQSDCDDENPDIYPGAPEICDGLDNDPELLNCLPDSVIDIGTDCFDDDGDGFCEVPPCRNTPNTTALADCNDLFAGIYPGAPEVADGTDNDCDGTTDEGTDCYDDDLDGYCENKACCINGSTSENDCDDNNANATPSNTIEDCNTPYDDDCDGQINFRDGLNSTRFYFDGDGDGYYPTNGQFQNWCTGSGQYTATQPNDCNDTNPGAHPNLPSTFWSATAHNGTSYDWNCDGATDKRWNNSSTCVMNASGWPWDWECQSTGANGEGWKGTVPNCGVSGEFLDDCYYDWGPCALICGTICGLAVAGYADFSDCTSCATTTCIGGNTCDPDGLQNKAQQCR